LYQPITFLFLFPKGSGGKRRMSCRDVDKDTSRSGGDVQDRQRP